MRVQLGGLLGLLLLVASCAEPAAPPPPPPPPPPLSQLPSPPPSDPAGGSGPPPQEPVSTSRPAANGGAARPPRLRSARPPAAAPADVAPLGSAAAPQERCAAVGQWLSAADCATATQQEAEVVSTGRGGFAPAPAMWVGRPSQVSFAVGRTRNDVAAQVGVGAADVPDTDTAIGRVMDVELEPNPAFDITPIGSPTRHLGRSLREVWTWTVTPKMAGSYKLRARVNVLAELPDGTTRRLDNYTSFADISVKADFWERIAGPIRSATTLSGQLTGLFKSWEGTFLALTALFAAIGGAWLGLRRIGEAGDSPKES
jgi:hypothetical protein